VIRLTVQQVEADALALTEVIKPDLAPFRANLDILIESINAEARLTEAALPRVCRQLALALRNRIEVSDWVRRYPEIREEQIEQPIMLTGLPRSGTTYFQYLFDPEPGMRMLRYWEGDRPCPPPGFAPETIPGRIEACALEKARGREKDAVRAKIAQIHLSDADGPEECLKIIDQTFLNVGHYWTYRVPGYFDHCLGPGVMREAYEHYRLVLQLLQWRGGKRRWVLKWPCHLIALDDVLAVFPDARFIVTHRDPVQALASNCSLAALLRRGTSDAVDPVEVGRQMQAMLLAYLDRLVTFDKAHSDRIAHVAYQTAVDHPELAVEQALGALGMEMSPGFAEAIQAWRRDNPPGKRGTHDYALEDYGLDAGEMARTFAFYSQRYAIAPELAASA
jgi:hypothetical protein